MNDTVKKAKNATPDNGTRGAPRRPARAARARIPTHSQAADRKSYDLYLRFGEGRFFWTNPDHGVTLDGEHISWVAGDEENEARLTDIAEVHLQTGNVGQDTIASCRIRFSDGSTVAIASSDSRGLEDDGQATLYVEFVHDLHARLAGLEGVSIAFTAGFSESRYQFGKVLIVVAGLFFVATPTILAMATGQWKALSLLYGGVILTWPLYKIMQANAPRSYDPRDIPEELVQTQPRAIQWLSWIQS
ncbi:MAG: hypothetical protein ACHQAY_23375 [Hyphomicrobiales bacterium]